MPVASASMMFRPACCTNGIIWSVTTVLCEPTHHTKNAMHRILLYSPDVVGHPRVYCRVIADALAGSPCELVLAMGFTEAVGLAHSPDIQPLVSREQVQMVDTREHSASGRPHLTAEELVTLQRTLGIATTLFIEADTPAILTQ